MTADAAGPNRLHPAGNLLTGKAAEIAAAVRSLESQGAKGLMLDLRQCALGTSEEGMAVANLFLDRGLMTYLLGQHLPRKDFQADPAKAITRLPLVVTTNRGTADGAEIAAMALLENKRAEVVGRAHVRRCRGAPCHQLGGRRRPDSLRRQVLLAAGQGDSGYRESCLRCRTWNRSLSSTQKTQTPRSPWPRAPATKPEDDNLLKKAIEVLTKGPGVAVPRQPGMVPRERNSREPTSRAEVAMDRL